MIKSIKLRNLSKLKGLILFLCLPLLFNCTLLFDNSSTSLIPQSINYTEEPGDIPNPDRGFYVPVSYIVPNETEVLPELPNSIRRIAGTEVQVESQIYYMKFDLRNFSSNSPLDGFPPGPWGEFKPKYGKTRPLSSNALNYIRSALQQIRDINAVAIVQFSYDGRGYTYNNRDGYNEFIHDCEPGAPRGRVWYESGGKEIRIDQDPELCGIHGHEDKNWVEYHLWQIRDIFTEFEDVIMCVKGGFFGPWGEMHSSTFSQTDKGYHWLLNALLKYVPESRSILVHAGGVMAWHNSEYGSEYNFSNLMPAPKKSTPAQRFGMFNDSYSRGGLDYTDGGSLSEGIRLIGGKYDRNSVLTWIRNQNNFYGGETVRTGNEPNNFYRLYPRFPNVPYEAFHARTTHLNTSYSSEAYKLWEEFIYTHDSVTIPFIPPHDNVSRNLIYDPVYEGKNGMEYIRDRLGYRLVLREAKTTETIRQSGTLQFRGKIQNVGFGLIVNKKTVSIILMPKSASENYYATTTDLDVREWIPDESGDGRIENKESWHDIYLKIKLNRFGDVPKGDYNIYMKITDPKEKSRNKRSIRFANKGNIWNSYLGANLIGHTIIK